MGDRANVIMRSKDQPDLFLYTHWAGYHLPGIVKEALARQQRWDDEAYLGRIIFCEMVKGAVRDETGFGISTRSCDNEYPFLVVDVTQQRVYFEKDPQRDYIGRPSAAASAGWDFRQYVDSGPSTMADVRVRDE